MHRTKPISYILVILAISLSLFARENSNDAQFRDLRVLIEKNFRFIDTAANAQASDFAVMRLICNKGKAECQFMTFDNAFQTSFTALKDSLIKKWTPRFPAYTEVYVPIQLVFDDDHPSRYARVSEAFNEMFRKSRKPVESRFWLKPVVLQKFERVK